LDKSPINVEEWLPISRDVREILAKLKEAEERPPNFYERLCRYAHRYLSKLTKNLKLTEGTLRTLSLAKLRVKPEEFWAGFLFSFGVPIILCFGGWLLVGLLGADLFALWYLPIFGLVLGSLIGMAFYIYPFSLSEIKQSEAQSQAINTIMLLSFALYHRPDLRGATVFAADTSSGKLAEDMQKGLLELDEKRSYESVRHLLTVLAHNWGEIDECTRLAIFDILRSSGQSEEAARLQDIVKAPSRVLESSELQLKKRLNTMLMPTLSFMVFGSLAIVGAIGLSPIFGMIGLHFIDLKFFALVAAVLVMSFLIFTTYMSRKRPATIPPPEIPPQDNRLPPAGKVKLFNHLLPIWLLPLLVFMAITWPGVIYLAGTPQPGAIRTIALNFNTFWFIWAIASATAIYAYLYANDRVKLREKERRNVADWEIAFNTMGGRMLDGKPMAQAMVETAELMPNTAVAGQLQQTITVMDRRAVDIRTALFEHGIIDRIYSPLVRSFLTVITRIHRGSEAAAGRACMMAAEFLSTLRRVENRFKESMEEAVGNLWLVAIILLPVVCAMSVWVMEFMSGISFKLGAEASGAGLANLPFLFGGMEAKELALLKLVMGITSMALSLVVARYIAVIRAGHDRVEFWSTAGKTILATTAVFTAAYICFGLISI
jgi:hypothetical protein